GMANLRRTFAENLRRTFRGQKDSSRLWRVATLVVPLAVVAVGCDHAGESSDSSAGSTKSDLRTGTLGMNPTYTAANFTNPYTFATSGGRCNPVTTGAAAVSLQKYSLYAAVSSGSVNVKMALYTDSAGEPSALVTGSTSQQVTITQTTPGWID